jgi:hypothetical protein
MNGILAHFLVLLFSATAAWSAVERPNVLFIALHDMSDWIGCLGGNYSGKKGKLYRIDAAGNREPFGTLELIKTKRVQTYTGEVWLVTDEQDKALGHLVAGAESARAEIEAMEP